MKDVLVSYDRHNLFEKALNVKNYILYRYQVSGHVLYTIGEFLARLLSSYVWHLETSPYTQFQLYIHGPCPCRVISTRILPLSLAQISSIYRLTGSLMAIRDGLQWFVSITGLMHSV